MNPASSEAKKATAWATSSGRPICPAGTREVYSAMASAGTSVWRSTGIHPGATLLTVMPCGASSRAMQCVHVAWAPLAVT